MGSPRTGRSRSLETKQLPVGASHMLQFELVMGCNGRNDPAVCDSAVELQYSTQMVLNNYDFIADIITQMLDAQDHKDIFVCTC